MKKFILGMLAIVMFSFAGTAQQSDYSNPKVKSFIDASMITLVTTLEASYEPGMSLPDWMQLSGPYNPSPQELVLLSKVHGYLSTNASDCEITNGDNAALLSVIQNGGFGDSPQLAGKWCWRCIGEWLLDAAELILPYLFP